MQSTKKITDKNFQESYLIFQDRQAGIGLVYCPKDEKYFYNVYCLELKLMKELFSVEYEFLDDALTALNGEFGHWEMKTYEDKQSGCGNCAAK